MLPGQARRAGLQLFRQQQRRMATDKGPFWSEGKQTGHNGYLFNESPPPPGQTRQWESWELPWYLTFASAAVILGVGLSAKPETSISLWAREEAKKELAAK